MIRKIAFLLALIIAAINLNAQTGKVYDMLTMESKILDLKRQGVTIFLTTHHMDDAGELCNRLAFMVEGTLPVIDSTQELRLQHGKKTVRVEYSENGLISSEDFPIDQLASNAAFSNILKKPEILTIHTQEASLEDIFIKVTGQQLKQ